MLKHFWSKWPFAKHLSKHDKHDNTDSLTLNIVKANCKSTNENERSLNNYIHSENFISKTECTQMKTF